jgi:glyoxylase-like metal-dependent hydrolase (beta-lactamase superfamily II)
MLNSWQIGDIRVTSLVEYYGPTHDPAALFPAFERASFEEAASQLPPGHYYPASDRLVIAIQIWLVEAGARRILIDAGCGNRKSRSTARMHQLNTLWPEWLAAAGQSFESISDVVLTHLHSDHVGWSTRPEGGQWKPSFPNARYHIPKGDYDFFRAAHADGRVADGGSFADSVEPVVAAGLADFIIDEAIVADCLKVMAAPGHTPGQLTYWLESRGEHGVFSADIFHHVLQVMRPDWNTAFCVLPDEARLTRAAFLDEAARTGALVMPCHFAPPHAGYIRPKGTGFVFEPARSRQIVATAS